MEPTSNKIILTEEAFNRVVDDFIVYNNIVETDHIQLLPKPKCVVDFENGEAEKILERLFRMHYDLKKSYVSPKELAQNLRIYCDFPSNHKKFGFKDEEPYNNTVQKYQNSEGEEFICKQDLYVLMQKMASKWIENEAILTAQIIFFKHYERYLENCCEFVKYDQKWLDELEEELKTLWKEVEIHTKAEPVSSSQPTNSYLTMTDWFKTIHQTWETHDFFPIETIYRKIHFGQLNNFPSSSIMILRTMGNGMKKIIMKRMEWLGPYSDMKSPSLPIVVRILTDGTDQFLIKSELFKALNLNNSDDHGFHSIMTMEEFHQFQDHIQGINFISYPIKRIKNGAAIPILSPTGDHCILAIDAFFKIIRKMIFHYKFFQKFTQKTWNIVKCILEKMEMVCSPYKRYPYFVSFQILERFESEISEYLVCFKTLDFVHFRSVDSDGFTSDDLRDELKNSKLTEMFPEIQKYADGVYQEVNEKKKEPVLRTCDLLDALEKCQIYCVLEKMPTLQIFIHNQNACHLFPLLHCDLCLTSSSATVVHKSTVLRELKPSDITITYSKQKPDDKSLLTMISSENGLELSNNFQFFKPEQYEKLKYFIMDNKDINRINAIRNGEKLQYLCSLTAFYKRFPCKTIYIRSIPSSKYSESRRVFTDEILEIIPICLYRQDTPITKHDARLEKYRSLWNTEHIDLINTISVTYLEYVLEEFDIDKQQITICVDPAFEITVSDIMSLRPLEVFSPRGKKVISPPQAVYHIFKNVVCGRNWNGEKCQELMEKVKASMKRYSEMEEHIYIPTSHVESKILTFGPASSTVLFKNKKSSDVISNHEFQSTCTRMGIEKCMKDTMEWGEKTVEVGTIWLRMQGAWLEIFGEDIGSTFGFRKVIEKQKVMRGTVIKKAESRNRKRETTWQNYEDLEYLEHAQDEEEDSDEDDDYSEYDSDEDYDPEDVEDSEGKLEDAQEHFPDLEGSSEDADKENNPVDVQKDIRDSDDVSKLKTNSEDVPDDGKNTVELEDVQDHFADVEGSPEIDIKENSPEDVQKDFEDFEDVRKSEHNPEDISDDDEELEDVTINFDDELEEDGDIEDVQKDDMEKDAEQVSISENVLKKDSGDPEDVTEPGVTLIDKSDNVDSKEQNEESEDVANLENKDPEHILMSEDVLKKDSGDSEDVTKDKSEDVADLENGDPKHTESKDTKNEPERLYEVRDLFEDLDEELENFDPENAKFPTDDATMDSKILRNFENVKVSESEETGNVEKCSEYIWKTEHLTKDSKDRSESEDGKMENSEDSDDVKTTEETVLAFQHVDSEEKQMNSEAEVVKSTKDITKNVTVMEKTVYGKNKAQNTEETEIDSEAQDFSSDFSSVPEAQDFSSDDIKIQNSEDKINVENYSEDTRKMDDVTKDSKDRGELEDVKVENAEDSDDVKTTEKPNEKHLSSEIESASSVEDVTTPVNLYGKDEAQNTEDVVKDLSSSSNSDDAKAQISKNMTKSECENCQNLQKQLDAMENQRENQTNAQEMTEKIKQLEASNLQLSTQNDQKDKIIQTLMARLGDTSSELLDSTPT